MGLFQKFFGGSKRTETSQSESYNKAFEPIQTAFSPMLGFAQQGGQNITDFYGGNTTGFDNYKKNAGFDFLLGRGLEGINSAQAGRRMFNSGATAKSLQEYGSGLTSTFADKYLSGQLGLAGLGSDAAKNLIGAGTYDKSTGDSLAREETGAFGKMMGTVLAAFSDPRLKKNVMKLGELSNGLGVYRFRYLDNSGPFIGVMADEVEKIQPEALGPVVDGYKTVNYELIEGI